MGSSVDRPASEKLIDRKAGIAVTRFSEGFQQAKLRNMTGSGPGVTIYRRIIENPGGTISVDSEPG